MFGLSPVELMVVGVVAILLFGSKLPEVARSLGGSYRELRKGLNEFQEHMRVTDLDRPAVKKPKAIEHDEEESYAETTAPKFVPPANRASTMEAVESTAETSQSSS